MAHFDTLHQIPTYRAATASNVVAPAADTAFFLIEGSATKTVIVERITLSGLTLTAAAYNSVVAEKFSTAASGGTATALTKVPLNSKSAASSANTCSVYTAAPTEGTLVGTVACRRILLQTTSADTGEIVLDFSDVDGGGVILNGTAQGLGVAFAAAPASAVTVGVEVQWKEL